MDRTRWIVLTTCLIVLPTGVAQAQKDSSPAQPPAFSLEQAAKGEEVYKAQCSRCHAILDHSGADFRVSWNGRSVGALFDYLRTTMPDDGPGDLSQQQYLDVTAYMLKLNGMPPGETPLTADSTVLKKLRIIIKDPAGGIKRNDFLFRKR